MVIDHISNLTKIRLDLSHQGDNASKTVTIEQSSFRNFKNLESLELICSRNLIENDIFIEFTNKNLQELSINSEIVQDIDSCLFTGLNRLKQLCLFNCQITKINQDAFKKLECLTKLDLSWNNLANTNLAIFKELTNLESLAFTKCDLKSIDYLSFIKIKRLEFKNESI